MYEVMREGKMPRLKEEKFQNGRSGGGWEMAFWTDPCRHRAHETLEHERTVDWATDSNHIRA
jgi:hypothetical protein